MHGPGIHFFIFIEITYYIYITTIQSESHITTPDIINTYNSLYIFINIYINIIFLNLTFIDNK
jgi:hypothetical protein